MTAATALVFGGQGAAAVPLEPIRRDAVVRGALDAVGVRVPDGADASVAATAPGTFQALLVAHAIVVARRRSGRDVAVVGQSIGEIAAAAAAGAVSPADAVHLAHERGRLPSTLLPPIEYGMVSINGVGAERCRAALHATSVFVAAENSAVDVILSGPVAELHEAVGLLGVAPSRVRSLPVVAPYHTPLMAPVTEALRPIVESMAVAEPAVPFVSATLASVTTDPSAIRAVLLGLLERPVRWRDTLAVVAAHGWSVADVGPTTSLARFVAKNQLDIDWDVIEPHGAASE